MIHKDTKLYHTLTQKHYQLKWQWRYKKQTFVIVDYTITKYPNCIVTSEHTKLRETTPACMTWSDCVEIILKLFLLEQEWGSVLNFNLIQFQRNSRSHWNQFQGQQAISYVGDLNSLKIRSEIIVEIVRVIYVQS